MFDVAIIGGGPGGYTAAIKASQKRMKTLLVEKAALGGTCLNWGCVPTKCFLSDIKRFKKAKKSNVIVGSDQLTIDLGRMVDRRDKVVKALAWGLYTLIKSNGIEVVRGRGEIVDPDTIQVKKDSGETENFKTKNIIIATGSQTDVPPFIRVDRERVITSDEATHSKKTPDSITIIGGGVIGLEFATVYSGLGSQVLILEMLPDIVMEEDEEIRKGLREILAKEGIKIFTESRVTSIKTERDSVVVSYINNQGNANVAKSEKVLAAVGRVPNTSDLGLEKVGISFDGKFIKVNDHMETNVTGVYAIGDIVGNVMLAHAASAEGNVAIENICGRRTAIDYSKIPNGIYTDPEIASVGMTEEQASEKGLSVKIGKFPLEYSAKAVTEEATDGFVKIIADAETDKILGIHILSEHATDLIGEALLAMNTQATIEDLGAVIKGHPSLSEIITEAALDADNKAVYMPKKY